MHTSTVPRAALSSGEIIDRFALAHRTASRKAVAAFTEATEAVVAHRPNAAQALERALEANSMLVAGLALKGFCGVVLARTETVAAARDALMAARLGLSERTEASIDERTLVAALGLAVEGRLRAAADRLETRLRANPQALLLVKLVHSLRFMSGDVVGMRRTGETILPAWSPGQPGYGYVLPGCHAFALEESRGRAQAALRVGREAVEREPRDAWGLHAVAHVFAR